MARTRSLLRRVAATALSVCLVLAMVPAAALATGAKTAAVPAATGELVCGDWTLTYSVEDNAATITGVASAPDSAKDLEIPAQAGGCNVTRIGADAFKTSADGETYVGGDKIAKIILPGTLVSIGANAFRKSSVTSVVLPAALVYVEQYAFAYCASLSSLTFAQNAHPEWFGKYAFYQDTALEEVEFPAMLGDSFKSAYGGWGDSRFGARCFGDCEKLDKVTFLAGNANGIADYFTTATHAFDGCSNTMTMICYAKHNKSEVRNFTTYGTERTMYYAVNFYQSKADFEADTTGVNPWKQFLVKEGASYEDVLHNSFDDYKYDGDAAQAVVPELPGADKSAGRIWGVDGRLYCTATSTVSNCVDLYPVDKDDMDYAHVSSPEMVRYVDDSKSNSSYMRLRSNGSVNLSGLKVYAADGSVVDSAKYSLHFSIQRTKGTGGVTSAMRYWESFDFDSMTGEEGTYRVWATGTGTYASTHTMYDTDAVIDEFGNTDSGGSGEGVYETNVEFHVLRYDGSLFDYTSKNATESAGRTLVDAASTLDRNKVSSVVVAPAGNWQACFVATAMAGACNSVAVFTDGTSTSDEVYRAVRATHAERAYCVGPVSQIGTDVVERLRFLLGDDAVSAGQLGNTTDPVAMAADVYEKIVSLSEDGDAEATMAWGKTAYLVSSATCNANVAAMQHAYAQAAPVFFTDASGNLPASSVSYAAMSDAAKSIDTLVVVGGTDAVTKAAETQALRALPSASVKRIASGHEALAVSRGLDTELASLDGNERTLATSVVASARDPAGVLAATQLASRSGAAMRVCASTADVRVVQREFLNYSPDKVGAVYVIGDFSTSCPDAVDGIESVWQHAAPDELIAGDTVSANGVLYRLDATFSANVTAVGAADTSLSSVTVPASFADGGFSWRVSGVAAGAFKGNARLTSASIATAPIGANAFSGCTSLKTVSTGGGAVGAGAFSGCSSLATLSTNSGSLGASAFANCKALKSVSSGAASLGAGAFSGCTSLASAKLSGKALSVLPASAFSGCTALKTLSLSSTKLKQLGSKALLNCKALSTLTIASKHVTKVGSKAFKGVKAKVTVKAPKAKLKKYKKLFRKAGLSKKAKFKKK